MQLRLGFGVPEAARAGRLDSAADLRGALPALCDPASSDAGLPNIVHLDVIDTAIGPMIAGSHEGALILLEFGEGRRIGAQLERLRRRFPGAFVAEEDAVIRQTRRELDEYFLGRRRDFAVPLRYPGSPFEEKVWAALLEIPYGETRSYEELALITSSKGAVRAVGSANGRNRIAIIIPCHRVVNKSGALGGYGGGLWRKDALLTLEQRA